MGCGCGSELRGPRGPGTAAGSLRTTGHVDALYEQIHALEQAGRLEAAKRLAAKQRELQKKARAASETAVKAYAALVQGLRWRG